MRDSNRSREEVSRRRYAKLLAAGGIAGLAGCPSGTETDAPEAADDETPTDTATPTETAATDGTGTPTETATETPVETVPPESERRTDRIRLFAANTPGEFDINPYAPQSNGSGGVYLMELEGIGKADDTTAWRGSPTFETPHHYGRDEIEYVTWVEDWDTEVPYDHYNYHDDRCTYWNGEPYDAVARERFSLVGYYAAGNKFQEGQVPRFEATDQWSYHWWRPRGEIPGAQSDPANEIILRSTAQRTGGDQPMPPAWSDPWIRRFEAAGTTESYQEQIGNLRGDRISLERLAANGWGSGPYEIRGEGDIGSDRVLLRLRDDDAETPHPNADHVNVPILQVQMGNTDRRDTLASGGRIDMYGTPVTPNGEFPPESLPDHVSEVVRYLQLNGGDALWWNMNNRHLANLWVRRALVAAVDFEQVGNNGWGQQRSIPLEHDTGMLDTLSGSTFSGEFLDSLHDWPITADTEQAAEYMQNAGYERDGGAWTDAEGNTCQFDVQIVSAIGDWVGAGQTIRQQLREFGIPVTFSQYDWGTWSNNLDTFNGQPNFDVSVHWYGQTNPFGHYKSQAAWWDGGSILGGDPSGTGQDRRTVDPDDSHTILNQPVQAPLPTEVGSIAAPTGADAAPNNPPTAEAMEAAGIDYEMVNMAEVFGSLRLPAEEAGTVQERLRTCARYYNYYLPKFAFHQYTMGMWGNVRDLDWPPEGHESLLWNTGSGPTSATLGGLVQASYDDELDREP